MKTGITLQMSAGLAIALALGAAGCSFAPKYDVPPAVTTPAAFKELAPASSATTNAWKTAEPKDDAIRGQWWQMFDDTNLNAFEDQVDVSNQTIVASLENFLAARAIVKQTRAGFFPTVGIDPSVTRSRQTERTISGSTTGNFTSTEYSLPLDASWAPDFWGSLRNTYRASQFSAQASLADLENTRLTIHTELAADYFTLRSLDSQIQLLNSTVGAYRDSLNLTKVLNKTGIDSEQDVVQAETQLNITEAQATNLQIQRAQMEHAVAVLIGQPPALFSIASNPLAVTPVTVPSGIPSQLLERRPDIAAAERLVAAANAQIGVARAAYFPTITLSGSVGYQSASLASLFSGPAFIWSVGGTLAETIFDAGRRRAVTEQTWANYRGTVATYRQTVLSAFQEVEDNLASLRILSTERQQQDAAVASSQHYLNLALTRYKLGVDSYLNVITAQTTLLSNQITALNLRLAQITANVQLVNALGGGWDSAMLTEAHPTAQQAGSKE